MDTTTSTDQALRPRDVILPVAAGVLLWPPLVWFAELVTDRLASDAPATIGAVGIALVVLGPALSAALAVLVFPLAHRRRTAVAVAVGTAPALIVAVVRALQTADAASRHGFGGAVAVGALVLVVVAALTSLVVARLTVRSARRDGDLA